MIQSELGAVAVRLIVEFPDVAGVMEQRGRYRHHRALGVEALGDGHGALVTHHQAGHRERHVQRVLQVVIHGVDAVIPRHPAGE